MPLNIEIKARCRDHAPILRALKEVGAHFAGTDRQVDTYFKTASGRLKLREGNIENALIHYRRPDQGGPKRSEVELTVLDSDSNLGNTLRASLEILTVVSKTRQIWFADNVKIHLDEVDGLGRFVEIEAIDKDGSLPETTLQEQCAEFMSRFSVQDEDLVDGSYSDMLMANLAETTHQ